MRRHVVRRDSLVIHSSAQMADKQLQQRQKLYFEISSQIAQIDNAQLRSLLGKGEASNGWGRSQIIDVGRSKVFVKRVPITDVEYENAFSTRNLYDLPTYYNYGVGSAGMGVFRELVAQIKTTNWVLAGAIALFPLMYHYRIIPFHGTHQEVHEERHARYVTYWGGNANIGRYMLDRARANYELVLFLEHIPYTVASWLLENPGKTSLVLADMYSAINFLRSNGIIHLDAHFNNMVTDGKRVYLTDFGLALDKGFDLTPAERQFYKQNSHYDYGELLWSLGSHLPRMFYSLPDAGKERLREKWGINPEAAFEEVLTILLNNIEEIVPSGIMEVDADYVTSLVKYRSIITFVNDFFTSMQTKNAKDTRFDNASLRRLLNDAGFVPATGTG